jgi:hypothetical protein
MSTPEQIMPPRREARSISDNYEDSEFRYHDEYEDFGGMSPDIGQHHLERHFASRETQQYPTREYHIIISLLGFGPTWARQNRLYHQDEKHAPSLITTRTQSSGITMNTKTSGEW